MTDQAKAYSERPFLAMAFTSNFSGSFRFNTLGEAFDWIFQMAGVVRSNQGESWTSFARGHSYVEDVASGQRYNVRDILLVTRV